MDKKTKQRSKVTSTVWRHWKPTFLRNGWGVLAIVFFYSAAGYFEVMLKPTQWKIAFDALTTGKDPWGAFRIVVFASCLQWLTNRLGEIAMLISETKIIKELKDYALRGLMGKNMNFFTSYASGSLVAKAKRFAAVSENVIDEMSLSVVKSAFLAVYLAVFTFFVIPDLSFVFTLWIILFVGATVYLSRLRMKYDLESSNADSQTTGHLSDILISILTFRIFTAAPREYRSFLKTTSREQKLRRTTWKIGNIQWATQGFLGISLELYCMGYIIKKVQLGEETIGTAVMVQAYIAALVSHMWGLGRSLVKVRTAFADAYEMSYLLDQPSAESVFEPENFPDPKHNMISIENISFGYTDGLPIIRNLNYCFESGRRYGLIGQSGSGKSTIIKLLLRFYESDSGKIIVRGSNIRDIDKHILRSWISFVPQHPVFPSRTIREIITLGKPEALEDEIVLSAEKAGCSFIWDKLPKGLDTHVGERGIKLSGGEAQRVAIAAAILKDAPIVIMDEPTSALDAETERGIQNSIKEHFRDKTLIVIAHRLSTVAVLDEVILMKEGSIVESAPHLDLLKISQEYRHMWDLQTNPKIFV